MDVSEQRLLEAFVNDQDDDAFRELVQRHLNMVYHTALRCTADPTLAEEVAQQVFTILGRKARRLKPGFGLGGWLHRTTLYESSKALRAIRRRATKMKEFADRQIESEGSVSWEAMRPVLDAAIDGLPNRDRQAITLRFFEGKSFRAIGGVMGRSEGASQKLVSRAVEKLGRALRRRGFDLSVAVVASGLLTESSRAAPAILHQVIAQQSIDAMAGVTAAQLIANTVTTMAYAKTKTALAVMVIAAVPMSLQWRRIQTLNERLSASVDGTNLVISESVNMKEGAGAQRIFGPHLPPETTHSGAADSEKVSDEVVEHFGLDRDYIDSLQYEGINRNLIVTPEGQIRYQLTNVQVREINGRLRGFVEELRKYEAQNVLLEKEGANEVVFRIPATKGILPTEDEVKGVLIGIAGEQVGEQLFQENRLNLSYQMMGFGSHERVITIANLDQPLVKLTDQHFDETGSPFTRSWSSPFDEIPKQFSHVMSME